MKTVFVCDKCAAVLPYNGEKTITCDYCGTTTSFETKLKLEPKLPYEIREEIERIETEKKKELEKERRIREVKSRDNSETFHANFEPFEAPECLVAHLDEDEVEVSKSNLFSRIIGFSILIFAIIIVILCAKASEKTKPIDKTPITYYSINYAEENKKTDCGDYYIVDGQYKEYK